MNRIGTYSGSGNVRFGSLAAPQDFTIPMAAMEREADPQQAFSKSEI